MVFQWRGPGLPPIPPGGMRRHLLSSLPTRPSPSGTRSLPTLPSPHPPGKTTTGAMDTGKDKNGMAQLYCQSVPLFTLYNIHLCVFNQTYGPNNYHYQGAIQQYDYVLSNLEREYSHTPLYDAVAQRRLWAMTQGSYIRPEKRESKRPPAKAGGRTACRKSLPEGRLFRQAEGGKCPAFVPLTPLT